MATSQFGHLISECGIINSLDLPAAWRLRHDVIVPQAKNLISACGEKQMLRIRSGMTSG
jgi:hypothetical protein